MAQKKPVQTIVDGLNLNARHFNGLPHGEVQAAIIKEAKGALGENDTVTFDAKWADGALAKMKADIAKADAPEVKK